MADITERGASYIAALQALLVDGQALLDQQDALIRAANAEIDKLKLQVADLLTQIAQKPAEPTAPATPWPADASKLQLPDVTKLTVLSTSDYTVKPGETIKLRKLVGKNIICRLKAGEEAYIYDSDLFGGYTGQWKLVNGVNTPVGERYCVDAAGNQGDLYIIGCRIHGAASACVLGDGVHLVRCHVFNGGADLVKLTTRSSVEGCMIEDGGMDNPASHADGIQATNFRDITIRRTHIRMVKGERNGHTYKASQGAILHANDGKTASGLVIEDSLVHCDNGDACTGLLIATGGNGATCAIRRTHIEAQIPTRLETGVKVEATVSTKILPKRAA